MDVFARNNVVIQGGTGPTFVFSHGFGCDQTMWRHVAQAFFANGRVVLFDHVGAGRSDFSAYTSAKYGSLQGYAADVVEICEALACDDLIFVGHSVSATIGVLAAVQRPDLFAKLVLICPSPRYANTDTYHGGFGEGDIDELLDLMDKNTLDWSALMSPVLFAQREPDLQEEWRDSVCSIDPVIAKEFARATFKSDHRAEYRQVTTSTLIVECAEDSLAPPEVGAYVHQAIAGSRRLVLDAVGHCPHMSAPDEVIAAIADFAGANAARAAA
ncbi:alpha/beta fold hydrolase [Phenylobacterium deserti]|uniref:Alpha/beta hydrolase n=1 Tax=Phenylobacterium deserti TaxID=1914756 RepID=A0A328AJ95_9CAUL|nr:alpha/beta hydrolase [Phenylobacterium deserti]RAK52928.1 alpha/beta hydrolase [Phenylobacterium deserti]